MADDTPDDKSQDVINAILPADSQGFLLEYYLNGLFGEKVFTKGLTISDYDIILSSFEAEEEEIFHILNICNTKFDPKTAPSRKVIIYEDLDEIVQPFLDGKPLAQKDFHEVTLHVYPKIRRNLRFNICSLNYKMVKDDWKGNKTVVDYKMEHEKDNPDNKDILCVCTFKLDGQKHKLEKFLQLLEQFKDPNLQEFWDHHRIAYFIFCVKEEKDIINEYNMFPEEIKTVNENYTKVRMIFYVNPPGEDDNEILNMYAFNDLGKNFYFHMNSNHVIYRADDMLCSGDIIENSIKRKKKEKENKELNKNKTEAQILTERNEAFLTFWHFITHIKDYKYVLYFSFQFDVCLQFDEEDNLKISYIDFSHIIGELRTKEYIMMKQCAKLLNPDLEDIEEIPTVDIQVDFSKKDCFRCTKLIEDNEDMYYCYKCKIRFCSECVWENYWQNKGRNKFIDPKHNLLYFKTRDFNQFKNIDKHKLGNDLFSQCDNESKLVQHTATCNGCKQVIDNSPRYLCLHCRQGKKHDDGYFDYCYYCVQDMMKKTPKGIEIEKIEDRLYSDETRLLYNSKETYRHNYDTHVYLMIALQFNCNDQPYYDF